jgi:hypothetical protein
MGELTRKGGFGCLLYGVAGREKMVKLMWLYGSGTAEPLAETGGGLYCTTSEVVG